ncbi:MAG TPA: hypothetical protein PKE63_09495 [Lacibacter sp.]|nr:hypothetical protein [Lacibacter sp.]HMO89691.1 hypothetical protein [Lacibacter sp.]HMP87499.1 hypothetical protein [Lacibacter sp.]
MKPTDVQQCLQLLQLWKQEGVPLSQMEQRLLEQETAPELAAEALQELKRQQTDKKRFSGFMCCGIGGGLLFASFLTTLLLFDTEHSFAFYLYGLTLIGVTVVFKGLVDLLGW